MKVCSKLALHKELLENHVSKLIDVIAALEHEIRQLRSQLTKPIISGKSQLRQIMKSQSQVDLLMPFRHLHNIDTAAELKSHFLKP